MKISELIQELYMIWEDEGDLPVVAFNSKEESNDVDKKSLQIARAQDLYAYFGKEKGTTNVLEIYT